MTMPISISSQQSQPIELKSTKQCLGHKELIKVTTDRDKLRKASEWALQTYQHKEHIQPGFFTEMEVSEGVESTESLIYVLFMHYTHVDNCESCTNFQLV